MDTPWKNLSNYSRYQIYNDGRVFDVKLNRFINYQLNRDGYCKITLRADDEKRKTFSVHKLVALCFISNPENKETINHIDGNKQNNYYLNLEWSTRSEQVKHAWDNGLITNMEKRKQGIRNHSGKKVICITTGEVFDSIGHAAETKNLKKANISKVCNNKSGYKSAGVSLTGEKLIWRFYE